MSQVFKLPNNRGEVIVPDSWRPEKIISPSGFIFANARGGPYKYGYPLKCTKQNLRLVEAGLL